MSDAAWLVEFIHEQIRSAQRSSTYLAVITNLEPFRIRMEGVEIGSPFLMVEPSLLSNTKTYDATFIPDTTLTGPLTTTPTDPPPLQIGDTVVVLSTGEQFAVIAKVVAV